jgi:L-iditol 2-dehydrogenase
MKAVALTGIRRLEVVEVPRPTIKKDTDVLLKIAMVGVCGSDVHYFVDGKIGSQVVQFPFVVGHECAAVVAEVGKAVKRVKVGQKIVVEPAMPCHQCDQCKAGRENTCRKLVFLGCPGQVEGCMAEYMIMPEECCFPADHLTFEQGVLCEPFAIGVYAVKQSQITKTMKAAILGSGPIGLSCLAAAQAIGARDIYMTEVVKERVSIAAKAGAKWVGNPAEAKITNALGSMCAGGHHHCSASSVTRKTVVQEMLEQEPSGMGIVFECVGKQETVDQAIELLKPGGRLMLIGIPREDRISFRIDLARRKELTVVNVRRQNGCTQKAMELVGSGKVNIDYMVTHHFKMQDSQAAFDMVADYKDGVVKAMIEF